MKKSLDLEVKIMIFLSFSMIKAETNFHKNTKEIIFFIYLYLKL